MKMQRRQTHLKVIMLTIVALTLATIPSCSNDEETYVPAYRVDLVEATVGPDSIIKSVRFDNGTTMKVSQNIKAGVADTLLRCLCTYMSSNTMLVVYSMKTVFSKEPADASRFPSRPNAPLKFISCWKSDRYLNMRIGILTTGKEAHSYAFSLDSTRNEDGANKAYFTLLHSRPADDAESFTEERFLSMPTLNYQNYDSLIIYLPTYTGIQRVAR